MACNKATTSDSESKISVSSNAFVCPERQCYNFIRDYLSNKTRINTIEIGTLHSLMTKHVQQDIDGVDATFPWRARGFPKFKQFVHSIPGLKFSRSRSNNHCVSIDSTFPDLNPFFVELEKVPIVIQSTNQRQQRRAKRKQNRHHQQSRSFHKGYDVLHKLSFLALDDQKQDEFDEDHDDIQIIKLRDSFYSRMVPMNIIDDDANSKNSKHKNYDFNGLDNIDWSRVPDDLCPEKVILSKRNKERRGTWKKRQIETFYEILTRLLPENSNEADPKIIVDFGCGSGNIGLALAFLFQHHEFILIDSNPRCIAMAKQRAENNHLQNVQCLEMPIQQFEGHFDIGIAVHACGNATDWAQLHCIRNEAHFVLCSCCVGKIKNGDSIPYSKGNSIENLIEYPRSKRFRENLTLQDFEELSRVADHNDTDYNVHCKNGEQRKLCKTVLEIDRCLYALETELYRTILLTQVVPYKGHQGHSSSPKNDVVVGVSRKCSDKEHQAVLDLFGGQALDLKQLDSRRLVVTDSADWKCFQMLSF